MTSRIGGLHPHDQIDSLPGTVCQVQGIIGDQTRIPAFVTNEARGTLLEQRGLADLARTTERVDAGFLGSNRSEGKRRTLNGSPGHLDEMRIAIQVGRIAPPAIARRDIAEEVPV